MRRKDVIPLKHSLIPDGRVRSVLEVVAAEPISPAGIIATLIRSLAVATCALGTPDKETTDVLLKELNAEIGEQAERTRALVRH